MNRSSSLAGSSRQKRVVSLSRGRGPGEDSRQLVLDFIGTYTEENQRPPTVREIQEHCGFKSPRAVSYILEKLEAAKRILRQAHSRGIQLIDSKEKKSKKLASPEWVQLPLFDSIPAGRGEIQEGGAAPATLPLVPATLGVRHPQQTYAVKVRGESMINAGILEGDIVLLEQKEPRENDIIAALIDGESTLKRLVKKDSTFFLQAENPQYPNLEPVESLHCQGVVISVLRVFK